MASDPSLGTDPRIGTVLRGKYRLDRVIGTGGMAVVYKATHRNHAEFAVKMLHPELSIVEDIRARFVREGYAANAVKHPGVVRVVDDDVAEDGAAFLVMELLVGVPCDKLWGSLGKRISASVASAIAIQLLDVLAAAHEKGIVHRDIKPANLFLTRDGVVKVLDFGIARAKEAIVGAHATGSGMTLGTPAFMGARAREGSGAGDRRAVGRVGGGGDVLRDGDGRARPRGGDLERDSHRGGDEAGPLAGERGAGGQSEAGGGDRSGAGVREGGPLAERERDARRAEAGAPRDVRWR